MNSRSWDEIAILKKKANLTYKYRVFWCILFSRISKKYPASYLQNGILRREKKNNDSKIYEISHARNTLPRYVWRTILTFVCI